MARAQGIWYQLERGNPVNGSFTLHDTETDTDKMEICIVLCL